MASQSKEKWPRHETAGLVTVLCDYWGIGCFSQTQFKQAVSIATELVLIPFQPHSTNHPPAQPGK